MVFTESGWVTRSKHQRGTAVDYYAAIEVSLECSSARAVDASGKIVREDKGTSVKGA
jgi:hypothetical protein